MKVQELIAAVSQFDGNLEAEFFSDTVLLDIQYLVEDRTQPVEGSVYSTKEIAKVSVHKFCKILLTPSKRKLQ